jgi:16S rRNA (adenine1518-N6/adenine1519-N6)-dimethyltransferase
VSAPDALPPLRDVVSLYGLAAKKSLGQNFLYDLNLTGRIARAAGPLENVCVVEIGPGPGGLTRALLREGAGLVIAIERDERCLPALEDIARAFPHRLHIIHGDALSADLKTIVSQYWSGPARICANLPYNIGTALLTQWLESEIWPPWFDKLTLMFQREVAERIVATPKERADYGRLGVLCGWRTQARILFDVPASAFTPPPKVTSSIVELIPRAMPRPCDGHVLSLITQSAFGQRRKMLRQSLKSLSIKGKAIDVLGVLSEAGIEPTRRAEEISIDDFVRLAQICQSL